MDKRDKDLGIIMALLQRLERQRLPRVLELKEKVDQGELLESSDIEFLDTVQTDAKKIQPIIDKYPQYHELAEQVTNLYREITRKALENEKKKRP